MKRYLHGGWKCESRIVFGIFFVQTEQIIKEYFLMKRKIALIVSIMVLMITAAILPASGATAETVPIMVNGNLLEPAKYNPIWNDLHNRILIQPEFFADYLGAEVSFESGVTTIAKNGHTISFAETEKRFVMDRIGSRNLESANLVVDDAAYIPLRFMCESLGAQVEWIGDTTVVATRDSQIPAEAAQYLQGVTLFDQSTIRLAGAQVIYIDPYRITGTPHDADIILVTHTHPDHFDLESIKNVMKDSTVLMIAGEGGADRAMENGIANVIAAVPNNTYTVEDITIQTIPAYNTSPDRQNHKAEHNFVGYIVDFNGVSYYSAGDTDYIDAMNEIEVDVAFLPIDGRFNMEETEAAQAANAIAPKVAVPYHYNNFSTEDKARYFITLLDEGITGVIMNFKMYAN